MVDRLESNIIIRTQVRKPNRAGFIALRKDLDTLQDKLDKLAARTYEVNIVLRVDNTQVRESVLGRGGRAEGAVGVDVTSPPREGRPVKPKSPTGPLARGLESERRVLQEDLDTGAVETTKIEETTRQIAGNFEQINKQVDTFSGGELQARKFTEDVVDLQEKGITAAQRAAKLAKARRLEEERIRDVRREQREPKARATQRRLEGRGFRTVRETDATITLERETQLGERRIKQLVTINKEEEKVKQAAERVLTEEEKITQEIDKRTRRRQAEIKLTNRQQDITERERGDLRSQGFEFQRTERGGNVEVFEKQVKVLGESLIITERLNTVTGERLPQSRRKDVAAIKEQTRELEKQLVQEKQSLKIQSLQADGFKEISSRTITDDFNQTTDVVRRFQRVSGNALSGITVELQELSTATGKTRTQVLEGAAAMRFLGDSISNAAVKVGLWTAATGLVFGTIRTFQQLLEEVKELESGTILLARVGRGLGRSFEVLGESAEVSSGKLEGISFEDRLREARLLTSGIVELTAALGGNAIEAQQAAATFLRTGQSRVEALESVRAALLAARIAEISVAEAAEFLSSALLQFNLDARQLLPVLDQLNSLSNNYKVTTDDLLQSISRAGSVAAEANTRLSELAAITAVVSQTTSRTGTQIGNALKTIQSRLDRLDTRTKLFEELGLSMVDAEGNTKSLSRVLLDLKSALDGLTPSQQKNITLTVAGIRQRNILIAAIRQAEEAIVAEFNALEDAGSAQEEAAQTADTAQVAINRLQGTFSSLANSLDDETRLFIKSIINALNGLIKFASILDGLPVKLLALVAAALAARAALQRLAGQSGIVTASTNAFGLSINKASASQLFFSVATRVANFSLKGMIASLASATVALIAFLGPLALISIIVGAVVGALSSFANAVDKSVEAQERELDINRKQIQALKQRRDAIKNVTNIITDQFLLLRRLQRQARETGEDTTTQQRRIIETIRRLQKELAIEGNQVIDLTGIDLTDIGIDELRKILGRLQELQSRNDRRRIAQLQTQRNLLLEQASALGNINEEGRREIRLADNTILKVGLWLARMSNIVDTEEEIANRQDKINKKRQEALEIQKQIIKLQTDGDAISAEESARLDDLLASIANLKDELTELQESRPDREFLSGLFAFSPIKELRAELQRSRNITDKLRADLKELREIGADEEAIQVQKELNKELDQQRDLMQEITRLTADQQREAAKASDNRSRELSEVAAISRLRQRQAKAELDSFTVARQRLLLQQQLAKARIEERQERLGGISTRVTALNEARGRGTEEEQAARQLEIEALVNEAKALQIKQSEDLTRLGELQARQAKNLFEEEAKIAEERKKSADEAQRALGVLSDEDKLRVLTQAQFFAENPDRQISFTEQLLGDADSNRILQRFFGGRAATFDPEKPTNELERTFAAAGLGGDRDLVEREKAVEKARKAAKTEGELAAERESRLEEIADKEFKLFLRKSEIETKLILAESRRFLKSQELDRRRQALIAEQEKRLAARREAIRKGEEIPETDKAVLRSAEKEARAIEREREELDRESLGTEAEAELKRQQAQVNSQLESLKKEREELTDPRAIENRRREELGLLPLPPEPEPEPREKTEFEKEEERVARRFGDPRLAPPSPPRPPVPEPPPGPRSDSEIIADALARQEEAQRQAAAVSGRDAVVDRARFTPEPEATGVETDEEGNIRPGVNIDVAEQSFDFSPIVDEFENALVNIVDVKIQEAADEFGRIVDQKLNVAPARPSAVPTGPGS